MFSTNLIFLHTHIMRKLLLGLAAGLSFGMLFAPEKGKDTREKLAKSENKFADIVELFKDAGTDASEEVQKFIESEEITDLLAKGSTGLDEIVSKGKTLSESGKTELATVFENVSKKLLENKKTLTEKAKKTATNVTDAVKEKISGKKKGFFS